MQPDCTGLEALPADPPDIVFAPDPGIPAAWAILVIVLLVAAFEIWALRSHHNTISHLLQRLSRARRWFKWLMLFGMGILTWHVIWGFPW